MPHPWYDADEPASAREPYCGGPAPAGWHPISQASFTEPSVSSCPIPVWELDDWENIFLEFHEDHGEPGSGADWGLAPDHAPAAVREAGEEHLLRCCEIDRPWSKEAQLTVRATGAFVTIHDFVTQVHPWLMGMRDDLLKASGVVNGGDGEPLPTDARLLVCPTPRNSMRVLPEKQWPAFYRKHGMEKELAAHAQPVE